MKAGLRLRALLALLVLLPGCSGGNVTLAVLRGNTLFRRGEDALAAFSYLEALNSSGGKRWEDWLIYDLGSLYVSLGEIKPGLRVLDLSLEGFAEAAGRLNRRDRELFFRVFFNSGVAHFEGGNFAAAFERFVQALRLKPDSWDAKINLELSLLNLAAASHQGSGGREAADSSTAAQSAENLRLLNTIHQEEMPTWASRPAGLQYAQDW